MAFRNTHTTFKPLEEGQHTVTLLAFTEHEAVENAKEYCKFQLLFPNGREFNVTARHKEDTIIYDQSYEGIIDGIKAQLFPDDDSTSDDIVLSEIESGTPFSLWITFDWSDTKQTTYRNIHFKPSTSRKQEVKEENQVQSDNPFA